MTQKLRMVVAIWAVAATGALAIVPGVALAGSPHWSIETTPNPTGSTDSELNAVSCTSAGACIAVGDYSGPRGDLTLAERWSGGNWTIQATPNVPGVTDNLLDAISCVGLTWCTAVGSVVPARSANRSLVEAWNGKRWVIEHTPLPAGKGSSAGLDAVWCTSADSCMAVGGFTSPGINSQEQPLAEYWNGSTWSVVTTPNPQAENGSFLDGISCPAPDVCIAGGDYAYADIDQSIFALVWDGNTWTTERQVNPVGQSDNADSSVACIGSSSCTTVGFWTNGGDQVEPLAEGWNGSTWSRERTENPMGESDSVLNGVSCTSSSMCEAVGSTSGSSGYLTYALVELWNGTRWSLQSVPNPSAGKITDLSGVDCTSTSECVTVGNFWNGTITQTLAEAYGA